MQNTINILSIDFDFFQDVDADVIKNCYPDGVDISTEMSRIVWSSRYMTEEAISNVKIRKDALDKMKKILSKCPADAKVLISHTHKDIYDMISDLVEKKNIPNLNIINVDMHHDMFNENFELDCGNWIKFVSQSYPTKITWIANPISREVYGLKDHEYDIIKANLDAIKNPESIDAVFLCRSDAWVPPHLDKYFNELVEMIGKKFNEALIEKCVETPRELIKIF